MSMTFLVAVDGSDASKRAAHSAAELARSADARLLLAHVVPWSGLEPIGIAAAAERHSEREKEVERARKEVLDPIHDEIANLVANVGLVVRHGHIVQTLMKLIEEEHVDHVFTGRRGRSPVKALLLGSVASSLSQACPVPFTVVP